jgi:hypothetical protein
MPKYIDSEALKRDLIDNRNFYPAIVANAIEHAPACDVVEVLRCKDCEHAHQYKEDGSIYCDLTSYHVEHYSFCSYGERKEEK